MVLYKNKVTSNSVVFTDAIGLNQTKKNKILNGIP